ncbi:hypothetical protein HDU79_003104 [Rhizoclosmatium sp. JEL0117]|nr:hypothetical protein HDU79_003104 [Rhizoclosmatium sp. JEL0117]
MPQPTNLSFWTTQSKVTEPGRAATEAIDAALAEDKTIRGIRLATSQLIFHYVAGDFQGAGVPIERKAEANLRTALALFSVLIGRQKSLSAAVPREPINKVVACCRDATVLFLSFARRCGIPARGRVGFAAYLADGWLLDHVVAEVWDEDEARWRLVDPQVPQKWTPEVNGVKVDWCDIKDDQFITAPRAWLGLRDGTLKLDHNRFVVYPNVDIPNLRSWPQIAHNVMQDLAMVNKTEMLLWDCWDNLSFRNTTHGGDLPESEATLMDEISKITSPTDIDVKVLQELYQRDGIRVPPTIHSENLLVGGREKNAATNVESLAPTEKEPYPQRRKDLYKRLADAETALAAANAELNQFRQAELIRETLPKEKKGFLVSSPWTQDESSMAVGEPIQAPTVEEWIIMSQLITSMKYSLLCYADMALLENFTVIPSSLRYNVVRITMLHYNTKVIA